MTTATGASYAPSGLLIFSGIQSLGLKTPGFITAPSALNAPATSTDGEQLTFRQLFHRQSERLAHAFMDNAQYEPFRLPC